MQKKEHYTNSVDPGETPKNEASHQAGPALFAKINTLLVMVDYNKKCHSHVTNAPKGIGSSIRHI